MGLVVNYIYLLLDITKRIYVILFSSVSIEQVRTLVVTRPRTISFASVVILISMCGTVKLFSEGQWEFLHQVTRSTNGIRASWSFANINQNNVLIKWRLSIITLLLFLSLRGEYTWCIRVPSREEGTHHLNYILIILNDLSNDWKKKHVSIYDIRPIS